MLQWAGYTCLNQNKLIKVMIEQNSSGKRPLERFKTRWEGIIKKDMQMLGRA